MKNFTVLFLVYFFSADLAFADSTSDYERDYLSPAANALHQQIYESKTPEEKELLSDINWMLESLRGGNKPVRWFHIDGKTVSRFEILSVIEQMKQENPLAEKVFKRVEAEKPGFIEALQENSRLEELKSTAVDLDNSAMSEMLETSPRERKNLLTKKDLSAIWKWTIAIGLLETAAGLGLWSVDYLNMKEAVIVTGIGGSTIAYAFGCRGVFSSPKKIKVKK